LQISTIREELVATLNNLQEIIQSSEVTNTLHSLRLTSDEARTFLAAAQPELGTLSTNLSTFTRDSSLTLAQFRQTLLEIQNLLAVDSPVLAQVQETLTQLSEASLSVRRLADSLERNPSALVTGRASSESQTTQTALP
jgi:paraquat-inducible protein B